MKSRRLRQSVYGCLRSGGALSPLSQAAIIAPNSSRFSIAHLTNRDPKSTFDLFNSLIKYFSAGYLCRNEVKLFLNAAFLVSSSPGLKAELSPLRVVNTPL